MSANVLLNLLNELGKRDKMRDLSSILSFFRNKFNKFNNTRARMLDAIKITLKSNFCCKNIIICKPLVVCRFYCMALFHSQTRRHMTCMINVVYLTALLSLWGLYDVVSYDVESMVKLPMELVIITKLKINQGINWYLEY